MARTRAWRRWKRYVVMMRRLKKDWNQHYRDLDCPCRTDPKFRSIMADTPKRCSAACCGGPRRYGKGKWRLSLRERRAGTAELGSNLPEPSRFKSGVPSWSRTTPLSRTAWIERA